MFSFALKFLVSSTLSLTSLCSSRSSYSSLSSLVRSFVRTDFIFLSFNFPFHWLSWFIFHHPTYRYNIKSTYVKITYSFIQKLETKSRLEHEWDDTIMIWNFIINYSKGTKIFFFYFICSLSPFFVRNGKTYCINFFLPKESAK